ncbi:MAG TPA: hypothetical protein ENJ73_02030 [Desulfobacterales bacterium]|nr:hypothetical protein [Desulfobacterales bacterium]
MKQHLMIILALVIGFTTFLLGYSLPPFMEVGFGGGEQAAVDGDAAVDSDLAKQYEALLQAGEEE